MLEFAKETLALLPFLFVTYLVLEAVEAHGGGALERFVGRARAVGPAAGALAGAIPQCGVAASAASFYAGGVISVGTLMAVFLSTSDELLPVLVSKHVPPELMAKIVLLKIAAATRNHVLPTAIPAAMWMSNACANTAGAGAASARESSFLQ